VANLAGNEDVVFTHGNTVIDAVLDHEETELDDSEKYGVVLLHRFEFISNPKLVEETISTLARSSPYPLKMLVDAYNSDTLATATASFRGNIAIEPKRPHDEFVVLLKSAEFMVTDSGGVQEEAALLGLPTLVHRVATERNDGVGQNVVLSGWNQDILARFLSEYENHRVSKGQPPVSPSDIVVEDLIARGYADS
jgi:UDP-N-acetylglucosamine 2-epimerase (non-hydrolysing)